MDCGKCREMIDRALDKSLDKNDQEEFSLHLEQCTQCRQEYTEMAAIVEAVQNLPEKEVPKNFRSRWQQTVRKEAAREAGQVHGFRKLLNRRSFQLLTAAAAVVIIAVAVPSFIPRFGDEAAMDRAGTNDMGIMQESQDPAETPPEEPEMGIMEQPQPEEFPEDEDTEAEPRISAQVVELDDSNAQVEFEEINAYLEENGIRHRPLENEIAVKAEKSQLEILVDWLEESGFDFDTAWLQDLQEDEEMEIRLVIDS